MKLEQIEIIINSMHGEMNTLKNEHLQLKQRLEALEKQGINSKSDPVDNLSLNVSINERIQKRIETELENRLPRLVSKEVHNSMPDYVSPSQLNSLKTELKNQIIDKNTFELREKKIIERISALETKKNKRFSFLTVNRTINEYYKDEVEKKLWDKYGYWLKSKKDIIWCFICVMIIMWAIIAMQCFQIQNLEERLNPTKEKIEIPISEI
ncbi:MAG: hypothetical protein J1E95_09275 [Muribaculaceae bacterium]|nr:hypothetical protein [Muribaculaceae bacterium]